MFEGFNFCLQSRSAKNVLKKKSVFGKMLVGLYAEVPHWSSHCCVSAESLQNQLLPVFCLFLFWTVSLYIEDISQPFLRP